MYKRILIFLLALLIVCFNVYAHSGRTDGAGGHYNRSTGEYHYHHGESAHQHPNGICPYDESENDNYYILPDEEENDEPLTIDEYREQMGITQTEELEEENDEDETLAFKKIMRGLVGCWWIILPIVLSMFDSKKKKDANSQEKMTMEDFLKKLAVKSYNTVKFFGYVLFSIEFPEFLNTTFETDIFGGGFTVISLIGFGLLAIYSQAFKEEGY